MTTVKHLVRKKYHGVKPPTKEDASIGHKHLTMTEDVVDKKIAEHKTALADAKQVGDGKSAHYHDSHLKKHEKEKKDIKVSKHTIDLIKNSLPHRGGK